MAARYWVGGTDTWDGTAGTKWALTSNGLGGQAVPTSADDVFFDAASGANTVTIGAGTAICSTLTMTGFTGTLAFGSNSIDLAGTGTITAYTGATTFSVTGTPLMLVTGNTGSTRSINTGTTTEANSISFNISAGSGTVAVGPSIKNLTFSGTFTGPLTNSTRTIYGNLTFKSGMTLNAGVGTTTFAATSGTQTITSAAVTLDFPITFNGTATYQLQDALTVGATRNISLQSGTLDLNNNNFFCGFFATNFSNTRSIAFGTGQIYVTGSNGNVYSNSTSTGFTATGSKIVNCTYVGSTGTRNILSSGTAEADMINFKISAGSDIFTIAGSRTYGSIEFTSGFTGTINNTNTSGISIYGDVTLPPSPAVIGTAFVNRWTFASATVNQTLKSNGQICQFEVGKSNGTTASLILGDDLNTTQQFLLTSGTINSNGYNITCLQMSFNNTNVKTLNLTNCIFTITGGNSTNGGWYGSGSNTTSNLTGSNIVFTTSGTARMLPSSPFPLVTMAGTGTLLIGQSATSTTITTLQNTVQPCTISLLFDCIRLNVTNFNLSGTAGNLVTLNSSVAGTAVNIRKSSGTVNAQYMYIQDSLADGGAIWRATNSRNAGNNTGWFIVFPISVRLKNDGTFLTDGSLQLDEINQNKFSINLINNKVYSGFFDEVITPVGAMNTSNTGITSVSGTFDEVTGIQ